jgi:hypothetical protein
VTAIGYEIPQELEKHRIFAPEDPFGAPLTLPQPMFNAPSGRGGVRASTVVVADSTSRFNRETIQ